MAFTRQQIVSKCRQLRKLATNCPTAPQGTPERTILDLSGLRVTLPPPILVNEARQILDETLSSTMKASHISPTTVDPKTDTSREWYV